MTLGMDFSSSLFGDQNDLATLITNLDGLLNAEKHMLTIIPYASIRPPVDHLQVGLRHRVLKHLQTHNGVSRFELTFYPPKANHTPPLAGQFFVSQYPSLTETYILLTVEPQEFVNRALIPYIEHNRPTIYLTLLAQNRLKTLLHDFQLNSRYDDLKVVQVSWKRRLESDDTRISSVTWANLGLDGAFNFAREQNGWFNSLNLEIRNKSRFNITREGVIKTDGEVKNIYSNLVTPICDAVHQGFELLKNRARSNSPSLQVRPLTIDFGADILNSTAGQLTLSDAIKTMDKASVALIHNNPYLQLSVVDYIDGSTFDLWVVNPREMTIVPQMKATVPGIRRLISHIFESYAEGQVKEFQYVSRYAAENT